MASSLRRRFARDGHQRRRAAIAVARPEGGSTAKRRSGDQGIAVAVMAALAQWARLPTRGVRAGAALNASDGKGIHAACGP